MPLNNVKYSRILKASMACSGITHLIPMVRNQNLTALKIFEAVTFSDALRARFPAKMFTIAEKFTNNRLETPTHFNYASQLRISKTQFLFSIRIRNETTATQNDITRHKTKTQYSHVSIRFSSGKLPCLKQHCGKAQKTILFQKKNCLRSRYKFLK